MTLNIVIYYLSKHFPDECLVSNTNFNTYLTKIDFHFVDYGSF